MLYSQQFELEKSLGGKYVNAKDFSLVADALAWPVTVIIIFAMFYKPVKHAFERIADALAVKTIKIKVLGIESELSLKQAEATFDEMLREIADSTNGLKPEEIKLFNDIVESDGDKAVVDLLPEFQRGASDHERLRSLRDRTLIRPLEKGSWRAEKHPVVTRFGELANRLIGHSEEKQST